MNRKLKSQLELRMRNVEVVKLEATKDRQHMMKAGILPCHLWHDLYATGYLHLHETLG